MNDIHDLIQAEYEKENYKIEYNSCKNGLAYIYCSSNALYEKDNLQSFEDKIIKEDRYEWSNLRADCKPEIEIFIRDIWLSWYVKGINSRINTYDKLIDFIRSITKGYTIRFVGASSGGFIGSILAMELNAEISYSFPLILISLFAVIDSIVPSTISVEITIFISSITLLSF